MALPMAAPAAASFMSTWGPTMLSVGSNLLGGLFGGKEKKGPSPQEQVNAQVLLEQTMMRNRPSWAVEGAKAAGIHPLVALGMSPYQGGQMMLGGDTEGTSALGHLARAGSDVSRAITARLDREERKMQDILATQTIERNQAEIDLINSQRRSIEASVPPPIPTNPTAIKAMLADAPTDVGARTGVQQLHQWVNDSNGKPIRILNPDLNVDSEVLSGMHALGVTLPDLMYQYITRPAGRGLRRFIDSGKKLGRSYNTFRK